MTVFNRKTKIAEKFTVKVDGGASEFQVSLRKMNMPEMLDFMAKSNAISKESNEAMASGLDLFQKSTYDKMLLTLQDIVDEVYGLVDEDGAALSWGSLDDSEKYKLLAIIDFDSVFELWTHATTVGRLKEDEKKV